ncbi:hypothetical protein E2P81_ATG09440 [Venturia nashicola]|uniref:Uncharacterized protein n=1 Tax=Venturia nashicola TaxID=86259 RepID=A0A4Z1NME5_9PEZI|nr:hypothetical protein E6O75_ATG09649 [Venturia nashicola]TLD25783.1 hypothetical protein E2P81_ATG09440 [Venturia nashicola]
MWSFLPILLFCITLAQEVAGQQRWVNLPTVPEGFNASVRTEINATVQAVWDATLDWPSYPNWNPFVRKSIITDKNFQPLGQSQLVTEGAYAIFSVQIPPLPLPVNAQTPDVRRNTQSSKELVTHVQPDVGRVAWKGLLFPDWFLMSERWTGVSLGSNGMAVYESREVFYGAGAGLLESLYKESLQQSFEAQGAGLKLYLERK